jgi:hypothetical protein
MRGLKKGEYFVSSLSEKVSDSSNGLGVGKYILEDEILARFLENNAMSQVSTGFNRNLGESATPQLSSNSDAKDNYLPTRFAPSVGNLGMVGATALVIFLSRYLGKKLWQNKEPNKEEGSVSKSEEIKDKSGEDLNPGNTMITEEKEMMRARDLEMKKLQILIRDKNKEIDLADINDDSKIEFKFKGEEYLKVLSTSKRICIRVFSISHAFWSILRRCLY